MAISSAAFEQHAQEGLHDASALEFDSLYRRYYPRLVALCRRRVREDALAEDIAQETLVRALTHLDAFDNRRPPWPWLKTIATNLVVDHFRKHAREVDLSPDESRIAETGTSIEEADLLRRAIRSLPRRQRAAVALRYLNDWDAHDAATFMGVTRPAYEQLLFRARRRLKAEYHRLSEEVSVGLFAGGAALRAMVRRAATRVRETGASAPLGDLASVTATQIVSGAVVLAMALGTHGTAPARTQMALSNARTAYGKTVESAARDRSPDRATKRNATGPTRGATSGSAAAAGTRTTHEKIPSRDLVGEIGGEDVQQPEDARIKTIVFSPRFEEDYTLFATGQADCPAAVCTAVLFASHDEGRSWTRLAAAGYEGVELLLPPSFGTTDARIFAMGRSGLQVSSDGGESFSPAAVAGASHGVGSAAMSPAFNAGDPSILIGAQTLMRYRDDTRAMEPVTWATGTGPLHPEYSPQYPTDDRVLVGGLHLSPQDGKLVSAVHTCSATACTAAPLGGLSFAPQVRLAPDYSVGGSAYAFTTKTIHRSTDGGASFQPANPGWDRGVIKDVAVHDGGRVFVAVHGTSGGVYHSDDGGTIWTRVDSPLFDEGAMGLAVAGTLVVASLGETGLACSADGGATWAERCPV